MSVVVGALSRHLFSKESGLPSYIFASFTRNDNVWVFLEAPHRESKTNIVSCGLQVNKTVGDVGHGSAHERAHARLWKINDYGKPIHLMILFLFVIKLN